MVHFMTIHFYDPRQVGPSTPNFFMPAIRRRQPGRVPAGSGVSQQAEVLLPWLGAPPPGKGYA